MTDDLDRIRDLAEVDQRRAEHDDVNERFIEGIRRRVAQGMDMSEIHVLIAQALSAPPPTSTHSDWADWVASLLCQLAVPDSDEWRLLDDDDDEAGAAT